MGVTTETCSLSVSKAVTLGGKIRIFTCPIKDGPNECV